MSENHKSFVGKRTASSTNETTALIKPYPYELLRMYRHRAKLTQQEFAQLVGVSGGRVVRLWESGQSLPKPERLRTIIQSLLEHAILVEGQEYQEACQLWESVKGMFDNQPERLVTYPIFDASWFQILLTEYQHNQSTKAKKKLYNATAITPSPQPDRSSREIIIADGYDSTRPNTAYTNETAPAKNLELSNASVADGLSQPNNSNPANNLSVSLPNNFFYNCRQLQFPFMFETNRIVGRETDLKLLQDLLVSEEIRLVSLLGIGGIGKTRLAVALAQQMANYFSGGIYFVDLAPVREASQVINAIAQIFELKEAPTNKPAIQALQEYLYLKGCSGAPFLLILDNFEQVTQASPVLNHLLVATPVIKLLVTSRQRLSLYNEYCYWVQSLALPPLALFIAPEATPASADSNLLLQSNLPVPGKNQLSLLSESEYAAIKLFVQRVRQSQPQILLVKPNEQMLYAIAQICIKLEGIPLAIELVAGWFHLFSPQELLNRLTQSFELLRFESVVVDRPERHKTLYQTIDWSYQLLTGDEQKLFRYTGLFRGGCTLEALTAIVQAQDTDDYGDSYQCHSQETGLANIDMDIRKGLVNLADKCLITTILFTDKAQVTAASATRFNDDDSTSTRYQMLETIANFAYEQLEKNDELQQLQARFILYYTKLTDKARSLLRSKKQSVGLALFHSEYTNIRVALGWLLETETKSFDTCEWLEKSLKITYNLLNYWIISGQCSEGRYWLDVTLTNARRFPDLLNKLDYADTVRASGILAMYYQADLSFAEEQFMASMRIYQALDHTSGIIDSLNSLAYLATQQTNFTKAVDLYNESLRLSRNGNRNGNESDFQTSSLLANLAQLYYLMGDYTKSTACYEESLVISEQLGDTIGCVNACLMVATLHMEEGAYDKAYSLFEKALILDSQLPENPNLASILNNYGRLYHVQGIYTQAQTKYEEALKITTQRGNLRASANTLNNLGLLSYAQGNLEESMTHLKAGLDIRQKTEDKFGITYSLVGFMAIYCSRKQPLLVLVLAGAVHRLRYILGINRLERAYEDFWEKNLTEAKRLLTEQFFQSSENRQKIETETQLETFSEREYNEAWEVGQNLVGKHLYKLTAMLTTDTLSWEAITV
jgi:predicted ATPase/DNA-binding transcriptional regulator YiaG